MFWRKYVPVAQRRAKAAREMNQLRKKGKNVYPVELDGRTIAKSFWGKGWCAHLESFSDYANRLPRGRTYVRNGSVCHLEIQPGRIEAMVSGSSLYKVAITIEKLKPAVWKAIKNRCAGQVGSMLELLQGKLSNEVMAVVTDRSDGLFPKPGEIKLSCSCPDWAVMCKHVASALYGVGSRLDSHPELLFLLRDVDAAELISAEMALPGASISGDEAIADEQLGAIFGVDLADEGVKAPEPAGKPKKERLSRAKPIVSAKPSPSKGRKSGTVKKSAAAVERNETADESPASEPRVKRRPSKRIPTGASVARLRNKLRLSVAEFSSMLEVTPASVYRWEATHGPLRLHARTLKALSTLEMRKNGK